MVGRPASSRRGDQSRRELVSIAIDCFSRYGYQGTSIDRIARAAGVTKGALYYHFKDKQDLLFGALDDRIGGFERVVVERVTQLKDPVAALHAVAHICVEQATISNHRRFILTLMVEALDTHPELSDRFRDMMRRFREFLSHTVSIGQRRGVFRNTVDPSLAAQLFVAALIGTELQYYQDPKTIRLRESMQAVVEQFCVWLSVSARPSQDTALAEAARAAGTTVSGEPDESGSRQATGRRARGIGMKPAAPRLEGRRESNEPRRGHELRRARGSKETNDG
jgi:TetR/AcrR family acrAB operon transcriptional repressor